MNRYESRMPRAIFIVGALALSVLTLGASVAPARLAEPRAAETVAYAPIDASAATEVAITPARIDVVGEREPRTMFGALKQFLTRKAQPS